MLEFLTSIVRYNYSLILFISLLDWALFVYLTWKTVMEQKQDDESPSSVWPGAVKHVSTLVELQVTVADVS